MGDTYFVLDKQLKKDERKSTNFLPKIRYMLYSLIYNVISNVYYNKYV